MPSPAARRLLARTTLVVALSFLACPVVWAQAPTVSAETAAKASIVRTTRDRVPVWTRSPSLILAMLPKDVDLEAIAKDAQWYQVRVPEKYAGAGGAIGFVYQGLVTLVSGPPPPERAPETATSGRGGAAATPVVPPPFFRARGYWSGAYEWFTANDSFKAILGQRGGFFYGGGGQVIFGHAFVDVSFEQFKKTGERAIVVDGVVFPLGITDTITMQPVTVTGGYRFLAGGKATPYIGGGAGSLHFKETSEFATADENTDERFTSYVVLGGVEYAVQRWLFVSTEARYTSVPNALGAPGISADYNEKNLGGFSVGFKVLVGR